MRGGVGSLAEALVDAAGHGGQVLNRQRANISVEPLPGGGYRIRTERKGEFDAHTVLFNPPP